MNLTDAKNKRPLEQISSQVMDLNLEFPHKFHASNHFSTRCMMDYHGLKSFNNFQHLIFTVSEALKSTANKSGFPIILQNSDQKNVYNIASSHIIRFKSYSGNFFLTGGGVLAKVTFQ